LAAALEPPRPVREREPAAEPELAGERAPEARVRAGLGRAVREPVARVAVQAQAVQGQEADLIVYI
jgi:hypothetical protein